MELGRKQSTRHQDSFPWGCSTLTPPYRAKASPRLCSSPAPGRTPAHPTALQGRFTLLTLAGPWGLSMRRFRGVRGVLP